MSYGKFTNGGVLEKEYQVDGYKPIIYTPPETPDGYRAVYHYVDNIDNITVEWEYIELAEEEREEIDRRGIDDSETLEILLGGAE